MLENVSYDDRQLDDDINHLVGKSYTFWESLKMGGCGSQKLQIVSYHESMNPYLAQKSSTKYCNIELRPKGIGIRFRYKLETMGWFVPYTNLVIETGDKQWRITDSKNTLFMTVKAAGNGKLSVTFLDKLEKIKTS